MSLVAATATRSTCCRRNVGCVILNARGHVLATGYNGVASGQPHCNDVNPDWCTKIEQAGGWQPTVDGATIKKHPNSCAGALSLSGTNLDGCQAIHAEQNALLQCRDVYDIDTIYVSASPCMTCIKLLMNTSCRRVVFLEKYSHPEALELWEMSGRLWELFSGRLTMNLTRGG